MFRRHRVSALRHEVRLISPAYVKPFVKRGKTDAVDSEAVSEAVTRKTIHFVPSKTGEQQAAAMVLKTRALPVRQRTQAVNALRAHLAELRMIATAAWQRSRRWSQSYGTRQMLASPQRRASRSWLLPTRLKLQRVCNRHGGQARRGHAPVDCYPWRRRHYGGDHQGACAGSWRVQVGSPLCRLAGKTRRSHSSGGKSGWNMGNPELRPLLVVGQRPSCGASETTLGRGRGGRRFSPDAPSRRPIGGADYLGASAQGQNLPASRPTGDYSGDAVTATTI
ncbi:hypothetical protein ABIB75_008095 [Bradyrhizobium sp. GM2.2]